MGVKSVSRNELIQFIVPPARLVFSKILQTDDKVAIERALSLYRERFTATGIVENRVYPGIEKLLKDLSEHNFILYLATSKPKVFATRILQHFTIDAYFKGAYGPDLDGNLDNKAELVQVLLAENDCDPCSSYIVGDRKYDIEAGKQNRIGTVGVTFGFGSAEELKSAGCDYICATVDQLSDTLLTLK